VETGINTDTHNGSKAVFAVAAGGSDASSSSSSDPQLVAFGGSDSCLRVWDVRAPPTEQSLAVKSYAGHKGWVSSVVWRPGSSHQVATGSYDGSVRVWDLRSSVPLGKLEQHGGEKVLCVGWAGPDGLVSGGADCKVQLYVMPTVAAAGGGLEEDE
jgi:ribosome biogenesis protein YTM1